jgi:hypothetical protein
VIIQRIDGSLENGADRVSFREKNRNVIFKRSFRLTSRCFRMRQFIDSALIWTEMNGKLAA